MTNDQIKAAHKQSRKAWCECAIEMRQFSPVWAPTLRELGMRAPRAQRSHVVS